MKELSGDIKLNRREKVWYLVFNFVRGLVGYLSFLPMSYWRAKNVPLDSDSPSRKYIDSFLIHELPLLIGQKAPLKILDIGCGCGYLRHLLQDKYSGDYVGLDVVKEKDFHNYDTTQFVTHFVQNKIEDYTPDTLFDLVVSNTSLEHIQNDVLAVEKAQDFCAPGGLQVHIIPSYWTLFLYLFHGYRQYSPWRIKSLCKSLPRYRMYRLGGLFSFMIHMVFITIPERLCGVYSRNNHLYERVSRFGVYLDRFLPLFSTMYVIVSKK